MKWFHEKQWGHSWYYYAERKQEVEKALIAMERRKTAGGRATEWWVWLNDGLAPEDLKIPGSKTLAEAKALALLML